MPGAGLVAEEEEEEEDEDVIERVTYPNCLNQKAVVLVTSLHQSLDPRPNYKVNQMLVFMWNRIWFRTFFTWSRAIGNHHLLLPPPPLLLLLPPPPPLNP